MAQGPEDIARETIDRMLEQASWALQDVRKGRGKNLISDV